MRPEKTMSDGPSSVTKRLALFGLAVLFVAWALVEAFQLLSSVWWQLLVVAVILMGITGGVLWWKWRRNNRW